MKIQHRLPLVYTTAAAIILIVTSWATYALLDDFRERNFLSLLEKRLEISKQFFLEQDKLSSEMQEQIRDQFLHTLDEETEQVYPIHAGLLDELSNIYPRPFLMEVLKRGKGNFIEKERQGIAIKAGNEEQPYLVVVTAVDVEGNDLLASLKNFSIMAAIVGIILLAIVSIIEAREILKPILNKIEKAQRISADNLHLRLNVVDGQNELGRLAIAFNNMLDRLENAFEIQNSFIRNASHEIRNPLTAILGKTELSLQRDRTREEYKEALEIIQEDTNRLETIVENLFLLAKTDATVNPDKEPLRIDELILEIIHDLYQSNPANQRLKVTFGEMPEDPERLQVYANRELLRIAILNLLENACKFSADKPVQVILNIQAEQVELKVKDEGVGIPKEAIKHVFEPFYRATNARVFNGTGIGLAMVKSIVEQHAGNLELYSEEKKGTTFILRLPLTQEHLFEH